jgi:hypothetical protein
MSGLLTRFDELGPDTRGDFLRDFLNLAERHNPIVQPAPDYAFVSFTNLPHPIVDVAGR